MSFKHKKKFGQNFLTDQKEVLRKIMEVSSVNQNDTVLEIGPGEGALTALLLEKAQKVVTIEIDRDLEKILRKKFNENPKYTLVMNDVLETDLKEYITVGTNLNGVSLGDAQKKIGALLSQYSFPEGISYSFTGDVETMGDTFSGLILALVVALALVYMIMASQFESLIHPFLIMFAVPLAITGAIFGLFITRNSITSTTFMGFIMLVGMVVNNGIVLVDYTNQLRERGMECDEALEEAGPNRLRPILMTTLTTVIGMIPTALALGEGTEMQKPMAIAIIFGLSISTLVTLVFIPVLYSTIEKIRYKGIKKKVKHQLIKNKLKDSTGDLKD